MLIVIDVMGTGEVEVDTSKSDKKKVAKKRRPTIHEVPQPALQIVENTVKR